MPWPASPSPGIRNTYTSGRRLSTFALLERGYTFVKFLFLNLVVLFADSGSHQDAKGNPPPPPLA